MLGQSIDRKNWSHARIHPVDMNAMGGLRLALMRQKQLRSLRRRMVLVREERPSIVTVPCVKLQLFIGPD